MASRRHLAAGVIALALVGSAPPGVPPDVAAWFRQDAATTIMTTTQEMVVVEGTDRPTAYAVVEVGEPRRIHLWTRDFLAGQDEGEPIEPIEEWVAPFVGDGAPAGVVTAWREDGTPTLAVFDDDADLFAALAELPAAARYVPLLELGAHFALVDDEVRTLVAYPPGAAHTEAGERRTLEEFRRVLPGWLAEAGAASAAEPEAAASRPWLVPVVATAGVLAALVLALLVRRAWRRTAHTDAGAG